MFVSCLFILGVQQSSQNRPEQESDDLSLRYQSLCGGEDHTGLWDGTLQEITHRPWQDSVINCSPVVCLPFTRWRRRRWCSPIWWCVLVSAPRLAPCPNRSLMTSSSLELKSCSRMNLEKVSQLLPHESILNYLFLIYIMDQPTNWIDRKMFDRLIMKIVVGL